jgi:hypothetical protein
VTTSAPKKKWSQEVTENSDALDLQRGVFAQPSAKKIASSLKASAEHSQRRKSSPFRSAMSMLNFYINRAGSEISDARKKRLEDAKDELRRLFDRREPNLVSKEKPKNKASSTKMDRVKGSKPR